MQGGQVRVLQVQLTPRTRSQKQLLLAKQPILNIYRLRERTPSKSPSKSSLSRGRPSRARDRSLTPSRSRNKENLKDNCRNTTPLRTLPREQSSLTKLSQHALSRQKNPRLYSYVAGLIKSSPQKPRPSPKKKIPTLNYYNRRLIKALNSPYSSDECDELYREHFLSSHAHLHRFKEARPVEDWTTKKAGLGPSPSGLKCLVLDLDETLIHCVDSKQPYEHIVHFTFPDGETDSAAINVRPHCLAFLRDMSKLYEIVIFTASQQDYAKSIVQHLDPRRQYVSKLLSREHCVKTDQDSYLKDLRVLERPLEETLIVDNSIVSYLGQPENGVPIIPFYNRGEDDELLQLGEFLRTLAQESDVRKTIRREFNFGTYLQLKEAQEVFVRLYRDY